MQKKIIVLALAAVFAAPAFADTTVYGVVDAVAANISASGTKSDLSVHTGGLAGSRLGVKSSEDLTGGIKASVVLEYSLDVVNAAGTTAAGTSATGGATSAVSNGSGLGAARQQLVSLGGDFGTVAAGYLQTTGYDFSRFDPTSGSLISPLHNITKTVFLVGNNASLKRLPRALGYTSPDMGGVTVGVNYSTGADGATNIGVAESSTADKATAYLVSANYVAGPFGVAVVYANKTAAVAAAATAAAVKTTETALGASYDLGMAKLFATYQTNKVDTATDANSVMSVSASAPFAASTVVLTYAKATMTAAGTDKDASGYTVAYLNSLSKTTTFYAAYSAMSQGAASTGYSVANDAVSGLAAGTGSSMVAAGLNKKF
jgi:predicted porin